MENSIIFNITEKEKKLIKTENEKLALAKVTNVLTDKNKTLKLTKKALETFKKNGVNLKSSYISYNTTPTLYNTIYTLVKNNTKIFNLVEK